jgi:hypothetical protein
MAMWMALWGKHGRTRENARKTAGMIVDDGKADKARF